MKLRAFYRSYRSLAPLGYVRSTNVRSIAILNFERSSPVRKSLSFTINRLSSYRGQSKCWRCNNNVDNESGQMLFCSKCNALQEPRENLNYFELIGVDECYDVNNTEIHDKYRRLQNLLHPDRFSNSSEVTKKNSKCVKTEFLSFALPVWAEGKGTFGNVVGFGEQGQQHVVSSSEPGSLHVEIKRR